MYLFDAKRLRDDLVHGQVSQADFAIYAFLVGGVSLPIAVVGAESYSSAFDFGVSLAHLVVALLGTRASYVANGRASGREFLNRFISLGWVVGVRIALCVAVPAALAYIALEHLTTAAVAETSRRLLFVGLEGLFFWRLSLQVSLVREAAA